MSCFTEMTAFLFDKNKISKIVDVPPKLCDWDFSSQGLKTIPDLSSAKSIVSLNLSNNSLKDLDVPKLPITLKELYIGGNNITSVPDMSKFTLLTVFNFDMQKMLKIGTLPLQIDKQIEKLDYNNSKLTEIPDISTLKSVRTLKLQNNGIRALDVSRLPASL